LSSNGFHALHRLGRVIMRLLFRDPRLVCILARLAEHVQETGNLFRIAFTVHARTV
jgi:hypothetical protein